MLKREILTCNTWREVMIKYQVPERTARRWFKQGYALVRAYPDKLPSGLDVMEIARRSAKYIAGRYRDDDLLRECEQYVLIELWKRADKLASASNAESLAYSIGKQMAIRATQWWRGITIREVTESDTIEGIAREYSVSVEQIREWNNLKAGKSLFARQQLKIFINKVGIDVLDHDIETDDDGLDYAGAGGVSDIRTQPTELPPTDDNADNEEE